MSPERRAVWEGCSRPLGAASGDLLVPTSWRPPGTVASPAITRCCAKPRPISTDCEAAAIDELIPLGALKGQISAARLLWRWGGNARARRHLFCPRGTEFFDHRRAPKDRQGEIVGRSACR